MAASGVDIEGEALEENGPRVRTFLSHAKIALEKVMYI
jgi:hypothetical protein